MSTRSGPTPLSKRNSLFRIASGAGFTFWPGLARPRACRRVPQGITGGRHGPADRGTGAVRRADALRGHPGAGAAACQAGAARYARRDPRRRRAAGGRGAARASGGRRPAAAPRSTRAAGPRSDPRTAALLNGIAGRAIELCEGLRLVSGPGGDAGPAGGARGRRAGAQHRARDAGGVHSRLRCRRAARRRVHAAPAGASERPGVAARRRRRRSAAARPRRRRGQPRDAHRDDPAADAELHQCGRRRDDAQRRRRDERLCRRARARAGAGRVRGAGRRDRGGARAAGRRRLHAGRACSTSSATRWEITRNYFRLYACCNPIHPALDCLAAALAELRPRPDEVERIEVATYRFASVMRNPDPPNYFASKYSLPHAAAAMVVRGGAGFAELDDTRA